MSTSNNNIRLAGVVFILYGAYTATAFAEVAFDGTIGAPGSIAGPDYLIEQNRGQRVGTNLFHSFSEFNIDSGQSATFTGDGDIANVISRVTGGEESIINGRLAVSIPDANLYLVNTAGVVFGEHASLDVDGAFHATTADHVVLESGGLFDVANPSRSILTAGAPERYGFISGNTGRVYFDGTHLRRTGDQSLEIVSGGIELDAAEVSTQSGSLTLQTAAPSSEVMVGGGRVGDEDEAAGGAIALRNLSVLGVGDTTSTVFSTSHARAGNMHISTGSLSVDHSNIVSMNRSQEDAGAVTVDVGNMLLRNGGVIASRTRAQGKSANVDIHANGDIYASDDGFDAHGNNVSRMSGIFLYGNDKAGAINIEARNITLAGSHIIADSGDINVDVARNITVSGQDYAVSGWYPVELFNTQWTTSNGGKASIAAKNTRVGGSGNINIQTNNFSATNTTIQTLEYITTRPGRVRIDAEGSIILSGTGIHADSRHSSEAGQIDIAADTLTLSSMSYISASAFPPPPSYAVVDPVGQDGYVAIGDTTTDANGGNIKIDAREIDITEDWITPLTFEQYREYEGMEAVPVDIVQENYARYLAWINTDAGSGIYASSRTQGGGGVITINADTLALNGRAKVNTTVVGEAGGGSAGDINIDAKKILLSGAGVSSADTAAITASTATNGDGGKINVSAKELTIQDGARIEATTDSAGNGGEVDITAQQVTLTRGGNVVTSTTGTGDAGDITVNAHNLSINGKRNTVDSDGAVVSQPSGLFAETTSTGHGGTIHITSRNASIAGGGQITTSTSGAGDAGDIYVASNNLHIRGAGSAITSDSTGTGDAGRVELSGENLHMESQGEVSSITVGQGQGGSIHIAMNESVNLKGTGTTIRADSQGEGAGGDVFISASDVELSDGATVTATSSANGDGGSIIVMGDDLVIRGAGSAITSDSTGTGHAGRVELSGERLHLESQGAVSSRTGSMGQGGSIHVAMNDSVNLEGADTTIRADSQGDGDGGDIFISASSVDLSDGATVTATSNANGDGGSITVMGDDLVIRDGALIKASSTGTGDAGSITIETEKSVRLINGSVETESAEAGGGNITILTRDVLEMDRSRISANVKGGEGAAGNIFIDPKLVSLRDSSISANAVHGDGGSIKIVAGVLVKDSASIIDASSDYGVDGDVIIDAPVVVVAQGKEEPHPLRDASVKSRCRAARAGDSTLIVQPRDGASAHSAVFFGGMADLNNNNNTLMVTQSGSCS